MRPAAAQRTARAAWRAVAVLLAAAACMRPAPAGAAPADSSAFIPHVLTADEGPYLIDDFSSVAAWSAHPATGVGLHIVEDGGAMRLDFDFHGGGGYAVARRRVALRVGGNYRFHFRVRGETPPNTLEFKLIAPGMENVWWARRQDFDFPHDWETLVFRKRHISFAWGPAGGGELTDIAAIEFAITAGQGGRGSVWIDDLTVEPLPEPGAPMTPVATASSALGAAVAARAVDGDPATAWRPSTLDHTPTWTMDLGGERALGGLMVTWAPGRQAKNYDVELSSDGSHWRDVRPVRGSDGGADPILLTDTDARYVRLRLVDGAPGGGVALAEVEVEPLEWGATREKFFEAIAARAPRGWYPRGYVGEQSYWTVVGLDADRDEALMGEDGRIEAGKAEFTVEPFIHAGGHLVTWADVGMAHGLVGGQAALPLPWVRWRAGDLDLTVHAYPTGEPGHGRVIAHYVVVNRGRAAQGTLYLALRPFQVNPPSQFLNTKGGTAPIRRLARDDHAILVDGVARVVSVTAPDGFGAATFDQGGVLPAIAADRLPRATVVEDPFEAASGVLAYAFDLAPDDSMTVDLRIALSDAAAFGPGRGTTPTDPDIQASISDWRWRLRGAEIALPDSEVTRTLHAQIGWIMVNRDGAAIQPGSRSYERSWIRDGALTSTALLRTGHAAVVRAFIEWFAPYLYADGKVPCCVDQRGSDPVPEHDSSGEFIYLVAEYLRHTGDLDLAREMWPGVDRAVGYLDSLRRTERTPEYRRPDQVEFFGLLPPSISHEGYSAKPMHSYWDDFFALRGFEDAAWLASRLGRRGDARRIRGIHDQFQHDLIASIRESMKRHGIDYIPGAADLGDFDATSTTIALEPGQALDVLPRDAVDHTFERYWRFFERRRDGKEAWDAMTPYEMRTIGAFVRLGWRDRAHAALDWFMTLRRPPGWAQWAEVVGHDPRHVRFLGDMPHTWVGSDFVRSVLDMLAYERESDRSIVIGAGVPWAWVSEGNGVRVKDLSTRDGRLGFTMRADGAALEITIDAAGEVPPGGFVLDPPSRVAFRSARVNGRRVRLGRDGMLVVRKRGVTVRFEP